MFRGHSLCPRSRSCRGSLRFIPGCRPSKPLEKHRPRRRAQNSFDPASVQAEVPLAPNSGLHTKPPRSRTLPVPVGSTRCQSSFTCEIRGSMHRTLVQQSTTPPHLGHISGVRPIQATHRNTQLSKDPRSLGWSDTPQVGEEKALERELVQPSSPKHILLPARDTNSLQCASSIRTVCSTLCQQVCVLHLIQLASKQPRQLLSVEELRHKTWMNRLHSKC